MIKKFSNRKFRVGRSLWAGLFPIYLMEHQGLLPDDFELVDTENFEDTVAMLANGELDANFQPLSDTIPLVARGMDLKLIFASDMAVGVDGFLANPEIQRIEDLKGKRIGLALMTYPHILLQNVLTQYSLSESEVTLIAINGEDIPGALLRHDVDVGHTWGIHMKTACDQGAHILFDSWEFPGLLVVSLVVSNEALKRSPEHWRRFIQGRERALEWWKANPEEALAAISEVTKLSGNEVTEMLNGMTYFTKSDNPALFNPNANEPPALYASGKLSLDFFREHGALEREISLSDILCPLKL